MDLHCIASFDDVGIQQWGKKNQTGEEMIEITRLHLLFLKSAMDKIVFMVVI